MLTASRLRQIVRYEPETGLFFDILDNTRPLNVWGMLRGKKVHTRVKIDGKWYRAGRLAYLYMKGEWPPVLIDHKDRDYHNDRWENLRAATFQQNAVNSAVSCRKKHGLPKGVTLNSAETAYRARISVYKRVEDLGEYPTIEEAAAAYRQRQRELHGEFAPNNWNAPAQPPNPEAAKPIEPMETDWLPDGRIVAAPKRIHIRNVEPADIQMGSLGKILGDRRGRKQPLWFRNF